MSLINVDFPNQPHHHGNSVYPQRTAAVNFDMFDLIRRKFGLIVFFTLLGIGLSLLYFFKAPKTYRSTAKIFVDEKNASAVGDNESLDVTPSVEQYLITLKSTKILAPAIDAGKFHEFETFQECDDVLAYLRDGKDYTAKPADTKTKSGVIQLAFNGPSKTECKAILDKVITSFEQHIRETTRHIGGESAELVENIQNKMLSRLNEVEKEIQQLTSRPEVLRLEGRIVNPHQLQLSMLIEDLHDLRRERTKIEAKVKNINAAIETGIKNDLIAEILNESKQNSSAGAYVATHDQYVDLKIQEQELLNQFGEDHPEIRSLRKKIDVVNEMRQEELATMRANGMAKPDEFNKEIVRDHVKQLERKINTLKTEELQISAEVDDQQQQSTSVAVIVERLNTLQRERERLEKGYYTVVEQLGQINALKEHLWRNLSILDPPSAAKQVAPSLPICGVAGLFLGGLIGLMFAAFKDFAEKTFRSSDDVAQFLNTKIVGHVNFFSKTRPGKLSVQYKNVKPEVVTIHGPATAASESYRSIRTAVFFRAQQSNAKIIQVTSPVPADGKSTTAANLAASIAQSGRRVLLLDSDLRKPVQHKMFGLTNDFGLSSVILGEMDPLEAVQVVQPEYLSVVTSGPLSNNPAELLTSARFEEILAEYRENFDFVLVDTPPILAVTDPTIVAAHSDLVYIVMRIRNGIRTTSVRAKEIIESIGINIAGIIVNGLRRRDRNQYEYSGQYDYGSYRSNNGVSQIPKAAVQRERAANRPR